MRLDNPDNNTRSGASPSSPPLHAEVRAAVDKIVMAISRDDNAAHYPEGYTSKILQAVADALLAGLPEKRNTKIEADVQGMGYQPYYTNSPDMAMSNAGWNSALDAVTRVIGELGGSNDPA